MMPTRASAVRRASERGGVTILVSLLLLVVVSVAAMGLSRETLREAAITGNESTGRKAYEAADSAIDWTLTWLGDDLDVGTDAARTNLQNQMTSLVNAIDAAAPPTSGVDGTLNTKGTGNMSNTSGTFRVYLYAEDNPNTEMNMTPTQLQPSEVKQAFDTEIRYLGDMNRSHKKGSTKRPLWLIRTIGRANIGAQSFVSQREILAEGVYRGY